MPETNSECERVSPAPGTSQSEGGPLSNTDSERDSHERRAEASCEESSPQRAANDASTEKLPGKMNTAVRLALATQNGITGTYRAHRRCLRWTIIALLIAAYAVYLGYAVQHDVSESVPLIVLTALVLLLILYVVLEDRLKSWCRDRWNDAMPSSSKRVASVMSWVVVGLTLAAILVFVIVDKADTPQHLMSAVGILVFLLTGVVFSKGVSKIEWRMVLSGLLIQFVLGLIILRWEHGYSALDWLSDQITKFLAYTDEGSRFVFGEAFRDHQLAFEVLMVILFFGAFAEVLYYYGLLQWMIQGLGNVMSGIMKVGPTESFVAAANIFLGPNNSALTVGRFIDRMTLSELHCVLTSGFATVTGSLLGAYVGFGVPPSHLVAATFMSAPAALSTAKIFYPEVDKSCLRKVKDVKFPEPWQCNVFHACSSGAVQCVKIVSSIAANLIGFIAGIEFFNATLMWFGDRAGVEDLTFQWLCSYLFLPIPFLMGVETEDCRDVARLIGVKLFLTDITAYYELGQLIQNREAGNNGTTISARSETLATYALCGFANLPDISICLAAIGAIAPSRKGDLATVAVRAMVAGNIACFITACVAGLLYDG